MVIMSVILAAAVLGFGVLFLRLHTLPERIAHKSHKLQFEIVAVLGLIALFTHMHIFWIAGLLLALIDFPDFGTSLGRIATSTEKMAGLEPGDSVLDLGTGTGMLAIPFARMGLRVTALDPEPAMLAAARAAAQASGVAVDFRAGGSGDLTPDMGPFNLVAMGRSFHWMDRSATLAMLDHIVKPGGAVALSGNLVWSDKALGWIADWHLGVEGKIYRWQIRGVSFDDAFRNALYGAAQVLSGNGAPQ